jgi:hypothetical protein
MHQMFFLENCLKALQSLRHRGNVDISTVVPVGHISDNSELAV